MVHFNERLKEDPIKRRDPRGGSWRLIEFKLTDCLVFVSFFTKRRLCPQETLRGDFENLKNRRFLCCALTLRTKV